MNSYTRSARNRSEGFSFIEVMLALIIVALALLTFLELLPVGLDSSRNATTSTTVAHILEDAHERLEGHALKNGPIDSGPFFYDEEGIFLATALDNYTGHRSRGYRVDIRLVSPADKAIEQHAPDLKAVMMTISWPVHSSGEVKGANKESLTYYVNALTGPGWNAVDRDFETRIEY